MATNVSIIEIDLGEIDKLISEDVAELHGESVVKLDTIIQERKQIQEMQSKREEAKQQKQDAVSKMMNDMYNKLVDAGETGIPVDTIVEMIHPTIANASAFTLRMKTILREQKNPYALKRKTIHKINHYIFEPFNDQRNDE